MPKADLVLEGGGVKGTGLVGALTALVDRPDPYEFNRIAGTSAGAIVASFIAAGFTVAELKQIMSDLDFADFEDESGVFKHLKLFGEGFGLLFHEGLFAGDFLHSWVASNLAKKGVTTWGDLKIDDDLLPENERYKLVVVVSDVSRGLELRLPWDFADVLGVDPDTQLVADAVRASASIPFFFRPFHLPAAKAHSDGNGFVLCTDGGMLSNYPIDIFDRAASPRWPTLGVKLSAREQITDTSWSPNAQRTRTRQGADLDDDRRARPDACRRPVLRLTHHLRRHDGLLVHELPSDGRRQGDLVRQRAQGRDQLPDHMGLRRLAGAVPRT